MSMTSSLKTKTSLNTAPKAYFCTKCNTSLIPTKIYTQVHCLCGNGTRIYFDMCWMYIDTNNIDNIIVLNLSENPE